MKAAVPILSGYRILWVMALFDLPVLTKPERKRATKFREFLLDEGFTMMQFSCYLRFTSGKEHAETLTRKISANVPNPGKVEVIWFTDKQYQNIRSFRGRSAPARQSRPDQLTLF